MKKFLKRATLVVALALPAIAWAQGTNDSGTDERRFFGSSKSCGPCNEALGYRTCTSHFYVFWIDFDGGTTNPSC